MIGARKTLLAALAIATAVAAIGPAGAATPATGAKSIVIVPGSFVDGSGWRTVHDILFLKGYKVTVVHQSHTTLAADVAATRDILEQQVGKVVLVGHSSGGAVISIAGQRDKVRALVYVSALVPEVGETISQVISSMPAPSDSIRTTRDGQLFFKPERFHPDFAADLTVNRTNYMAASQVPATVALVGATVWGAAWRDKPSYGIVSRHDRALSPDLQRWMYKRAKSTVTELDASHVAYMSQPEAVAKVIEQAALAVK